MSASGAVAFILKGYPRLSETFIAQEILALEKRGLAISIWSMRPPRETERNAINAEIAAPVSYLPERLREEPARVLAALGSGMWRKGFSRALRLWLSDMRRRPSADLARRFGQALVLARELEPKVDRLHAHFLHTPASLARYASALTGLPWSCSAHAKDIWTIGAEEKRTKLADVAWLTTCTAAGHAHLQSLSDEPGKVELAYHGLDLARLPSPPDARPSRDGSDPADPIRLLSVGRAVEKKGLDLLLDALAGLDPGVQWRWTHIGDGECLSKLKHHAEALKLSGRIDWLGARPHAEVMAQYRAADLFVLPCRVAGDGDRDGLPNVLMEAQSQALACLSTNISAIPELIRDGETGMLAPPDDWRALAAALRTLIGDPDLRARLGQAGHERVRRHFSHEAGLERLARRFGLAASDARAHGGMSRVLIHVQYLKGIGHLARAGLIAEAAVRRGLEVHIASGGLPLPGFAPHGVTLHQLPALHAGPGGFSDLRDRSAEPIDDAWRAARRERTLGLFNEISPDALVIESFPFGRRMLEFELLPLLEAAAARERRPAILCSIRDILQRSRKPGRAEETAARLRQHFDAVMAHGDPRFAALEETFPAAGGIADILRYTGFVAAGAARFAPAHDTPRGEVLVSAGGGAVGPALAEAALAARGSTPLADAPWRIITGPNLPQSDFERLRTSAGDGVHVERFRGDFPSLLAAARLSISHSGYNTVCDLMRARTPAVLVSYGGETGEETEQATRAARCEARGLGVALTDRAVTPEHLAAAIARALALPRPGDVAFDLDGAENAAAIIARYAGASISGRSA